MPASIVMPVTVVVVATVVMVAMAAPMGLRGCRHGQTAQERDCDHYSLHDFHFVFTSSGGLWIQRAHDCRAASSACEGYRLRQTYDAGLGSLVHFSFYLVAGRLS